MACAARVQPHTEREPRALRPDRSIGLADRFDFRLQCGFIAEIAGQFANIPVNCVPANDLQQFFADDRLGQVIITAGQQ